MGREGGAERDIGKIVNTCTIIRAKSCHSVYILDASLRLSVTTCGRTAPTGRGRSHRRKEGRKVTMVFRFVALSYLPSAVYTAVALASPCFCATRVRPYTLPSSTFRVEH